ncbi:MAG: TlpA disulfide reductase family protein [Acidimicrobiaceae bacterium]|nr:TlpA disulfide reductase family protein [Acidimicrobiaceae bacterium]
MRGKPPAQAGIRAGLVAGLVVVLAATVSACGGGTAATAGDETPKIVLSQDSPGFVAGTDISPDTSDGTDLSDLTFDLFDGGAGTIAGYEGKPLVVNFFASWCPPCVREMPEFQGVFESLDGEVAFLGLSQDQTPGDALALVERTGVTYDVGWDLDLEVYGATESIAMPTTAFVSPSGELLDTFAGILDAEALTELIENVLGVRPSG